MDAKPPHPIAYLLTIVPFGAISGFTSVALAYTGTQHGVSSEDAALIVAFGMAPQVVKFLWAPLCDMTLNRRAWYLLSAGACIAGVLLMGTIPLRVRDSDGDGLGDSVEDANSNHRMDPGETDLYKADTDSDGVPDGIEDANKNGPQVVKAGDPPPETPRVGTADEGETSPLIADSDGDGLLDGAEDANANGTVDGPDSGWSLAGLFGRPTEPPETDPLRADSDEDGLADAADPDIAHAAAVIAAPTVAPVADFLPEDTVSLMKLVVLITSFATSTLAMAVEGIIAHLTPPEQRGRVAGWLQSGNLGGGALGGGLALWLMQNMPYAWMGGAAMALIFAMCAAPVAWLPHVPADPSDKGVGAAILALMRTLWDTLSSRNGLFAVVLCFAPISTGAAGGVLAQSTVAAHWGATVDDVVLVNGLAAGFCMTLGCFVGGQLCAYVRSRTVYAVVGAMMATIALIMAFAPSTRATFIVGLLFYQFGTGLAYASWTGFILETIGVGGAATKYNIFASLSNTPITYMGVLLGYAVAPYGADGMLLVEAGAGLIGTIAVLGAAQFLVARAGSAQGAAPVAA